MPTLVHLATTAAASKCQARGIQPAPTHFDFLGVHALPLGYTYYATDLWARQASAAPGAIRGVFFSVAPDDPVEVAHLARRHRRTTALEAVELITGQPDRCGYEIFILRTVAPGHVVDVKAVEVETWQPPSRTLTRACNCPVCKPIALEGLQPPKSS